MAYIVANINLEPEIMNMNEVFSMLCYLLFLQLGSVHQLRYNFRAVWLNKEVMDIYVNGS